MNVTTNLLISGVGGQGVILASFVLSQAAMADGLDVKQSEVHGMSQRGGSVTSHLRFGPKVWAALITPGAADVLVAFEELEAARYLHWLRPGGTVVYNTLAINPSPVAAGMATYPHDIAARIEERCPGARAVDAARLAMAAGEPRATNMAMLGAASAVLPLDVTTLETIIERVVPPKTVQANLRAFRLGRES